MSDREERYYAKCVWVTLAFIVLTALLASAVLTPYVCNTN